MTNKNEAPPQEFFLRNSGSGTSPWEIQRPQKTILELVKKDLFHGQVLDVGCGIADNAIYIASHTNNIHLTAIDLAPKAIEVAREKADSANVKIEFEVVNMLEDLSGSNLKEHSFDVILDSATYHLFSDNDRQPYVKNLEYLIKPGGLYIQIVFSEKEIRQGGPRRITKYEINQSFSSTNGWTIQSIEDSTYEFTPDTEIGQHGKAYLSLIRRNNNNSNL